ncbi:MAG: hypothetical protein UR99_C0033G0005 [Candidatus Moranbacteria bacterium GW2011_GWD2_36_12]|nr:MAG: hypothetical protein UR99_C0033G0005 [Candidatus Moranbacteria bacterium GW2011_GWD2_36_12]KKQ05612.1 MAG: hypothetical protein US16_C0031G0005 [Candidatus Moranbacteria bacterium GW2011_GWE2_36_40]
MDNPEATEGGSIVFNKKIVLSELRSVNARSLMSLYVSQALLFLGVLLILGNNLDLIVPGSYFGALSWLTLVVFSIGIYINFVSIPYLYFSSFNNFKSNNDFWDRETFWILPLFFFGTFFLRSSEISVAFAMLAVSVFVITIVHVKFFLEARKILANNMEKSLAGYGQYFVTLKYLSAYYLILLILLISYNPLQHFFIWIRLNM